ncbi:restriction endonuclease [Lacticaseibacillus saniviri]|uniref:restriction endonuclease n=1 Tax=Lacticaseibacillus saniviri TaxID=931533 RepID=UPI000704ADAC|nr:DEAD/DEAH box helicase family protein [Lacticaseibacillus saniviri]MCG4282295.1 DEAD/DEAH box helicase family protein [Lacticaseibacillus saniviri]
MKIQFDTLDYQNDSVNSATNVFEGQTFRKSNFTISNTFPQGSLLTEDGIGIGNRVIINEEQMLSNVNKIQISNHILPSESLYGNNKVFPQFNVEMETGTGKTFVYLKTIFELNKKYGFLKFVIVVPSVAIKEGVLKFYEISKEYLSKQYNGTINHLFQFDSNNLGWIQSYASANTIEIMVTTIQSFNKDLNVMNRENDQLSGAKPIDLIAETRPILIIDEPQSVDNTDQAKEALSRLKPSAAFRYSATHKDTSYPTIYRLTAVDAYEQQLVKQIEVAGIKTDEDGNRAYMKLISVNSNSNGFSARIEVYKRTKNDADKKVITFKPGDDVYTKTKLQVYEQVGFIQDMDATPGNETVYFSGFPDIISLNSQTQEDEAVKRGQISKTIEEHLDKELRFAKEGRRIKVLSLFFLDKVENYCWYDEEGVPHLGRYAKIFEDEYRRLIRLPKYRSLNDIDVHVEEVHDGYFSVDKKGVLKDTSGATQADESTYTMIMKNKEGLLTFYDPSKGHTSKANKIRFIFSHSALKEGWDNPNVFQIATLVESKDTITKRQKIGRGLRIAVDETGTRVPGFDVNTLTVMANESYKDFAEGLQREYEEDGVIFGLFESDSFATIVLRYDEITEDIEVLGKSKSKQLFNELKEREYINNAGRATDFLRTAVKEKSIELSDEFKDIAPQVLEVAASKIKNLEIRNADERVQVKPLKEALPENFLKLWDKVKYKTSYKINFDSQKLIEEVVKGTGGLESLNAIKTKKASFIYSKANLQINQAGILSDEDAKYSVGSLDDAPYQLPDIITFLQNETNLTRKTIVGILTSVDNLDMFKNNPLAYMTQAAKIINAHKNQLIVDGIKYTKTDEYYDQSLFSTETLYAYLGPNGNSVKVDEEKGKTVYDYVVTDSEVEREFARSAEKDENVKFYVKLPDWFTIRTPLGPYNPDWALLYEEDDKQELYFVVETKGDISSEQLRPHEYAKIKSGEKHFQAISTDIKFRRLSRESDLDA